jgi:hypothetical protein
MNNEFDFFITTEGENILMNDPVHNNKSQFEINKSQVDENDSKITILKPPNQYIVKWNPQRDITTFELAQCLPLIIKISQTFPITEVDIDFEAIYIKHFTITKLN